MERYIIAILPIAALYGHAIDLKSLGNIAITFLVCIRHYVNCYPWNGNFLGAVQVDGWRSEADELRHFWRRT